MRQVVRLPEPVPSHGADRPRKEAVDRLRPHRGRYVARKAGDVLVVGDTPREVVDWLRAHHVQDAAVFRVPIDPSAGPLDVSV